MAYLLWLMFKVLMIINKTFSDMNSTFCFPLTICHRWANWTTFHSPGVPCLLMPLCLLPLFHWSRWNSLNSCSSLKVRSSVLPNILCGPLRYTLCTHTYFDVRYCKACFFFVVVLSDPLVSEPLEGLAIKGKSWINVCYVKERTNHKMMGVFFPHVLFFSLSMISLWLVGSHHIALRKIIIAEMLILMFIFNCNRDF